MGGTLSTTAEDLSPADGAAWCKRIGLSQYGCRVGEASLERVRAWASGFGYETRELYAHLDGWPADSLGSFDYEQVNLAVGSSKAAHAGTIETLAAQLKAHYAAMTE